MAQISPQLPVIGNSVSTEEPKVKTALEQLVSTINSLDNANISNTAGILGSKLADTSIAAGKLASNSVETAKIVDDAVTAAKLKDSTTTDADRAVTTDHIRNAAVTTGKLADDAVTIAKLSNPEVGLPTYSNSATDGDIAAEATKYTDGLVVLSGIISRVTPTNGTQYATLPSGFRPANTITACCWIKSLASGTSGHLGAGAIEISSTGALKVFWTTALTATPVLFILDGIAFKAA